jgi:hypothetical protein
MRKFFLDQSLDGGKNELAGGAAATDGRLVQPAMKSSRDVEGSAYRARPHSNSV